MIPLEADKVFLHFRAGKMTYENHIVTPDLRGGYLSFSHCPDDVEMVWTSQATREVVRLPKGRTKVSFVEKCKTGRVLLFEVSDSDGASSLHFFWMQDKSPAEDSERLAALINSLKETELAIKLPDFVKILNRIPSKKESANAHIPLDKILFSLKTFEVVNQNSQFFFSRLSSSLPENHHGTLIEQIKNPHVKAAIKYIESQLIHPTGFLNFCRENNLPASSTYGVAAFLNLLIAEAKKKNPE